MKPHVHLINQYATCVLLIYVVLVICLNNVECEDPTREERQINLPAGKFELNHEKKLISDLLNSYKVRFGRPVINRTENILVKFEVFLVQLIDLDERNQVLISNVETQYEWRDIGLVWNKDDYGGVADVRLPVDQIWTPDIVLYNYADTRLEEKREVLVIVNSDGKVRWRPSSIYKSTCQINIQNFPYDHQSCRMKFGSWTYDYDSIDIQFLGKHEINRELFLSSNEWDVLSTKGNRNAKKYECCKEIFPDITYEIKMKRKGGFYKYILVLPCILLSCLTTVLFFLPPESPAKMLLGMNIFTSFFVMLLLLSKNVPSATDKIPLIGAYYCLNMVMIATSTCACTVVVHIFFRGNGKVPYILRIIFLEFLARLFCMMKPPVLRQRPKPVTELDPLKAEFYNTFITSSNINKMQIINRSNQTLNKLQETVHQQKQQCESRTSVNSDNDRNQTLLTQSQPDPRATNETPPEPPRNFSIHKLINYRHSANSELDNYRCSAPNSYKRSAKNTNPRQSSRFSTSHDHALFHQHHDRLNQDLNFSFNIIENDIKEIRDYLRHTRKKIEIRDTRSKNSDDWKQLALILDRLLFFIYFIVIMVSMTLMFPR